MQVVDLTFKISKSSLFALHPFVKNIQVDRAYSLEVEGFNISKLSIYTHSGTHIDAPYHMVKEGFKLDAFPLDKLFGEAIVLNVNVGEYGEIHAEHLEKALQSSKLEVKDGDFLLINTMWWHKYYDKRYDSEYLAERHPGLFMDAADWIISKKFALVGIDVMSIRHPSLAPKYTGIKPERVHVKLLSNNILIVEQLVNLDILNNRRVKFGAFPLNISDLDGSPVRACAFI